MTKKHVKFGIDLLPTTTLQAKGLDKTKEYFFAQAFKLIEEGQMTPAR